MLKKIKTILAEILGQNRSQFIITHPNHHLNLYSSLKQEWKKKKKKRKKPTVDSLLKKRLVTLITLGSVFQVCSHVWAILPFNLEAQLGTNPGSFRWLAEFISLLLQD